MKYIKQVEPFVLNWIVNPQIINHTCILLFLIIISCTSDTRNLEENFFKDLFGKNYKSDVCFEYDVGEFIEQELVESIYSINKILGENSSFQFTEDEKILVFNNLKGSFYLKQKIDSKDSLKQFKYALGCHHLYNIVKPIFLRDNKFCVFYYSNSIEGQFIVYKRTIFGWKKEKLLYGWIT